MIAYTLAWLNLANALGAIKSASPPFVTEPRAVATGLLCRADFFNNQRPVATARGFGNDARGKLCLSEIELSEYTAREFSLGQSVS